MSPRNEEYRPNPDLLLEMIEDEEQSIRRGRLKVFLGYAAGVGKTFSMLQQGHWRQTEGLDVVVGYAETHGRDETDVLLEGLEVLPRRSVQYQETMLTDLDLDAVLHRHPQLVLVDELAHTNAPGGRHEKRFQDVEEILAAGIDVYTTLNIQHLESLNDTVAQITGIVVRETIPDDILDSAYEIELIDLPPDELLQRLREGRVYVPEQAARAIKRFFRKGNLTALREIALRRTASRVDDQLRSYMQTRAISGPWAATERLLVCVGPSPLSARLLRTTRRLAQDLKAEWLALYVETPDQASLSPVARERLAQNLRLAEQLGAPIATIAATTVADGVAAYARGHNVTKIIVGKPLRSPLHELLHGSIVDQIIRKTGIVDIYVISSSGETTAAKVSVRTQPINWLNYAKSAGLVAAATLLGLPLRLLVQPTNLVMLYLAAVLLAAQYLGRKEALLASFLGTLAFDFFFVPPYSTFAVADTQYLLTFVGLLGVGLVISSLAARARAQAEAAQRRQSQAVNLYELSRALAATPGLHSVLQIILDHVVRTFNAAAVIFLPEQTGLAIAATSEPLELDDDELAVATWSWQHGEEAGPGTDTLSGASFRYMPLQSGEERVGVLGVRLPEREGYLPPDERRLLESAANLAALAVERVHLAKQAGQAELLRMTEKLQSALLNSISHDLRTPLASITGVLSSLAEGGKEGQLCLDEGPARELLSVALSEAERLNHLVGNLLDMSRLEAGALHLHKEPCDLQDLIGSVLTQMGDRLKDHFVTVDLAPDLPLVPLDFVLVAQVLSNLLDNSVKYAPAGTPINIMGRQTEENLIITVADRGPGIPEEDLERVFDRFQRVTRPDGASGTGLGLAINRGIIEAHGGQINASPRPGGGLEVQFSLPLLAAGGKQE